MKSLQKLCLNEKSVIIFDMDGTLIDSIGIWNLTDAALLRHYHAAPPALTQIQTMRDTFLSQNQNSDIYLAYCAYLKSLYHLPAAPEDILSLRWHISEQHLRTQIDYKPQADLLLKAFKHAGKKLALATVTTRVQLQIYENENSNIRCKAPLRSVFDFIISKEDVTHKKPHPEIYQKAADHFHVSARDCLVFEDSYLGVLAAKNAGMEVVNIEDAYAVHDRSRIDVLTDYFIRTYQEFLDQFYPGS